MGERKPPTIVDAAFVAAVSTPKEMPAPTLAEAAFAGRSNVGKSSLMNVLLGRRKLVRTGSKPGTTRALNFFLARTAGGLAAHLVDLPGYGYARTSKGERASWGPLVEGYLKTRVTLRSVALLMDVRRGVQDDDLELVEFVRSIGNVAGRPPLELFLVATKIDKLSLAQRAPALAAMSRAAGQRVLSFSAETGEGTFELWRELDRTICRAS
jgi:GTP-binding protein